MARYRHTWRSNTNGWYHRLDIVPIGETLAGSITTLPAGSIGGIGENEAGFADDRPLGIMQAATMSFTLRWNHLPTALRDSLKQKSSGTERNTFLFFTDRGTNQSTWTLEFAGCPEIQEGAEYEVTAAGDYEVVYECRDCLSLAMLAMSGAATFDPTLVTPADTFEYKQLYEVNSPTYVHEDFIAYIQNPFTRGCVVMSWGEIATFIRLQVSNFIETNYIKSTNTSNAAEDECIDPNLRLADMIDTGARFKTATNTSPRQADADVTDSIAKLIYKIEGPFGGNTVGGLFDTQDQLGWAQAQSLHNVMVDLCETLFVKLFWNPVYNVSGSGDYINYNLGVACIFSNGRSDGTPAQMDLSKKISIEKISEGGGTIARAEVRITTPGGVAEKNVLETVVSDALSRDGTAWTREPIIHNTPTYKRYWKFFNGTRVLYDYLTQTNLILVKDDTSNDVLEKVHEDTQIVLRGVADGGTVTDSITVTNAEQVPIMTEDVSGNKELAKANPAQDAIMQAWVNEIQRTSCLPYALATAAYEAFGNELQALTTVTWVLGATTTIDNLGKVHDLVNAEADAFDHFNWGRAVITKISINYDEATSAITYFMPEV